MKNKIIPITTIILGILALAIPFNYVQPVNADSGFDSSYDSGSSWSGSSSSNWSSSSDNDWGRHNSRTDSSSSNSKLSQEESNILIAYFLITFILLIITILRTKKYLNKNNKVKIFEIYTYSYIFPILLIILIINPKIILKLFKNNQKMNLSTMLPQVYEKQFLTDRYNDFVEIQKAWMNFNYKKLRTLLTDELYNQYEMQLETLKIKNQKNVMSDFVLKNIYLRNVKVENNIVIVNLYLKVEFYDYIEENKKVVRGNSNKKIRMEYNITFTSNLLNKKIKKCPNCGAPIENQETEKCEYCKSILEKSTTEWVMSKKEVEGQENL